MKTWKIVLAIYLLLAGLIWMVPGAMAGFPQGVVMGIFAIVAAILLVMDK